MAQIESKGTGIKERIGVRNSIMKKLGQYKKFVKLMLKKAKKKTKPEPQTATSGVDKEEVEELVEKSFLKGKKIEELDDDSSSKKAKNKGGDVMNF